MRPPAQPTANSRGSPQATRTSTKLTIPPRNPYAQRRGTAFATGGAADAATARVLARNNQAANAMRPCQVGSASFTAPTLPQARYPAAVSPDPVDPHGAARAAPEVPAPALGTFRAAVGTVVRRIPPGSVASYGDVAAWAGRPGAARQVGAALRGLAADDPTFPWHRVVNARGEIRTWALGAGELQVALLQREGVTVERGRVDLARHRVA